MIEDSQEKRLNAAELMAFFDKLFPNGFAGVDVLQQIAPEQWDKSPLLACFHPSPEQVLQEQLHQHRRLKNLFPAHHKRYVENPRNALEPEPTMQQVLAEWEEQPINMAEEVTRLVAVCLWDVFSDNHEVIAGDGRLADIGSFRSASAFLDAYLAGPSRPWGFGDEYRFYMGSIWISQRADLTPVYKMIFQRLKSLGADWNYHFPQVYLVDWSSLRRAMDQKKETYSPSEAFAEEQEEQNRKAKLEKVRAELEATQEEIRREAMEQPPPETVRAYQQVYGRDPNGWPPVSRQAET